MGCFFSETKVRQCEIPSGNGSCSARGLAKIAACIINGGELEGVRIISEEALRKMQDLSTYKIMAPFEIGTDFSQGGVNFYRVRDDKPDPFPFNRERVGFVGWAGFGGSVFQWHPEHKISFAYVPTLLQPLDLMCLRGAFLQAKVLKCVESIKKGN